MKASYTAGGILAIVVGRSTSIYLPDTLQAVAAGTRRPDHLTLVLLDDGEVDTTMLTDRGIDVSVQRSDATATGAAYQEALGESEWTWLLHADSAPTPTCLAELHRTCEASKAVAAAGPKQVGWDDPSELLEAGIRATRSGRRVPELDPGEKDQGQFDTREDVLAVGTAGMLLRTEALVDAGGFDPVLGPFGDGLELSRRLRAAGHRVVVVPSAVIRHVRESFADTSASFGRRRGTQMYTAVQRAPLFVAPFLFLLYLVLAPFRALARLAIKDSVRARGELRAGATLFTKTGPLLSARKRLRVATVTRSYRGLEATHGDVMEGRSDIRKAHREAELLRSLPPAHERKEQAERKARTRASAFGLSALLLVVGLVAFLPQLGAFGLTGGALRPDDSSAGDLLRAASSSWVAAGDGHPGYLEPLWLLAVPLAYVANLFGAGLTEVIYLFCVLAPMLAGLAAFRAVGPVANAPAVRFAIGLVWALAPPHLSSLSVGEVGASVFHIAVPLLVAALVRYAKGHRSSSLGASAWWALIVGAAYPATLLVLVAVTVVMAVVQRRKGWLWMPVPGIALAGPALWFIFKSLPESLLWLPGHTYAWISGERWEIVAGWPLGLGDFAPVILVATGLVALGALFSTLRSRRSGAVRAGWFFVGAGGLLTAFALSQTVGVDTLSLETAVAWPGPGLSMIWLGLLLAVAGGAHGIRADLSASSLSVTHVVAAICALGVIALPISGAASWLTGIHTGSAQHVVTEAPDTQVPALALKSGTDPERGRTLVLSPSDQGIRAELWRGDGEQLTTAGHLPASGEALADAISRLGEDDFADRVASHAVTVILIPAGGGAAAEDVMALLDATDNVSRVTTSDLGTFWRVTIPSGRVMQDGTVLPSGTVRATVDAEEGPLYLAERDDPQWVATMDGERLEPIEGSWQAAWHVPEAGTVEISHEGGFGQWWVTLIRIFLIAGNITVSLPWRAR